MTNMGLTLLAMLAMLGGCASSSDIADMDEKKSINVTKKEAMYRNAYHACLKKEGKDSPNCLDERNRLFEEMQESLRLEAYGAGG
jgi:hypothetical protein